MCSFQQTQTQWLVGRDDLNELEISAFLGLLAGLRNKLGSMMQPAIDHLNWTVDSDRVPHDPDRPLGVFDEH